MCRITLFTTCFCVHSLSFLPISLHGLFQMLVETWDKSRALKNSNISKIFQKNKAKETAGKVHKKSHLKKSWAELTANPTSKSVNWKTNLKKTWLLFPELISLLAKPGERKRCNSCISAAGQRKARQLIWLILKEEVLMKLSLFLDLHQTCSLWTETNSIEHRCWEKNAKAGVMARFVSESTDRLRLFKRWVPLSGIVFEWRWVVFHVLCIMECLSCSNL